MYFLKRRRSRVVYILLKKALWSNGIYHLKRRSSRVVWLRGQVVYLLKEAPLSSGITLKGAVVE